MYPSMRNKKPVREGSRVMVEQAGPLACLHLLLILKQTQNLVEVFLGARTCSAKLVAP